jgi:hypothetical protein
VPHGIPRDTVSCATRQAIFQSGIIPGETDVVVYKVLVGLDRMLRDVVSCTFYAGYVIYDIYI